MPKKAKILSHLAIANLHEPGFHPVGYITGLGLQIKACGSKKWAIRYSIFGRRRILGLGDYPTMSLSNARAQARIARSQIWDLIDPKDAKCALRQEGDITT